MEMRKPKYFFAEKISFKNNELLTKPMSDYHACMGGHAVAKVFRRTGRKKNNSREKKTISEILHFNIQHVLVLCHFIKKGEKLNT